MMIPNQEKQTEIRCYASKKIFIRRCARVTVRAIKFPVVLHCEPVPCVDQLILWVALLTPSQSTLLNIVRLLEGW